MSFESTFTTALPREANLKVHFKESLESPRKMQALFFQSSMLGNRNVFPFPMLLPRETPLAFPREQTHTLKFILILTLHSLFAITQPLATYSTTFGNLSQVAFNKQTKASRLQMELVPVFKKGLLRFDSSTTQGHSIFLSWITVSIIQNLWSIFSPQDVSQKIFVMMIKIRTKRLASSLDTQLMFSLGLSDNSKRHFRLQCLVFQSFFLTKAFERTCVFACKLTLHIQMQLWT
jgi:hypothetical protein